jgi:hypothetical protein
MAGGMVNCEHCKDWFQPPSMPDIKIPPKSVVEDRREAIRRQARGFTGAAIFIFIIGIVALFSGLCTPVQNSDSATVWIVMGACFGLAVWLYLIAQIIHIRANTER